MSRCTAGQSAGERFESGATLAMASGKLAQLHRLLAASRFTFQGARA